MKIEHEIAQILSLAHGARAAKETHPQDAERLVGELLDKLNDRGEMLTEIAKFSDRAATHRARLGQ